MPGAAFHSFFWQPDQQSVPDVPVGSSASGGYVPWQTSIIPIMGLLLLCRVQLQPCR